MAQVLEGGGIKIKNMKKAAIVAFIGIVVGYIIGTCIARVYTYVTASKAYTLELHNRIDSLNMEIELRDEILNRCKDTVFGEEVIETNK